MELRTYTFIDVLQPKLAGFLQTVSQGFLPLERQASLFVEVAPGIAINTVTDVALKRTRVVPGMQIVERAYGLLEIHSGDQGEVRAAGAAILEHLHLAESDRLAPRVLSREIITGIDDHQSAMIDKMRHGDMLAGGPDAVHAGGSPRRLRRDRRQRGGEARRREPARDGGVRRRGTFVAGRRRGGDPPGRAGDRRRLRGDRRARERIFVMSEPVTTPLDAIDAAIAERLLSAALGSGGDYADLYFEYRSGADFAYEEGHVRTVGRGVTLGLGVRVLRGDATGYAYTEELSDERMLEAARTAAQIASSGGAPGPVAITPIVLPNFYSVPRPSLEHPGTEKVELLRRADKAARAADPRIVRVEASLSEEWKEVLVVSSDGRLARDRQPMMRFGVSAVAEEGKQRQGGRSGGAGRFGMEYFLRPGQSPEEHGREAARLAIGMLHAVEAPAGPMEVVLGAGESGILLHEAVGHGLEADFNRKRTSNYTDQVGQPVASALCTVIDDGTIGNARGSINVDDEGNPGRRNVLIQDGILVGYMQDRISAKHFGSDPSGNGRRESFRHEPLPRMTNTILSPGQDDPEDIIRSVKRGVYAKHFSGGQVNISNGDFVFSLTESYLIEDGKITAPLKGVNLIGNGPDVLRKVTMLGNDFKLSDGTWTCGKDGQSVPVGIGTPTVKISEITVGGSRTS